MAHQNALTYARYAIFLASSFFYLGCNHGISPATQLRAGAAVAVTSISPNSGLSAGNYQATLSGSGFQNGAIVSFGGVSASIVSTSSNTIVCSVPPNSGASSSISVVVTNPDGGTANIPFSYSATSTLPFSDNFVRGNNVSLGANWLEEAGAIYLQNNAAVSQVNGSQALVNNFLAQDAVITASSSLNVTAAAGASHLLLRYNATNGTWYDAYVLTAMGGASTTAVIGYQPGGNVPEITLNSVTLATPYTSGTLSFSAIGDTLTLSVNGTPVLYAFDQTLTGPGMAGMQTGLGNSFTAFQVTPYIPSSVALTASSPTVSANFGIANSLVLGSFWTVQSPCGFNEGGGWQIINDVATVPAFPTGTVTQTEPHCTSPGLDGSRAFINGVEVADVEITATPVVQSGSCGWVLGRAVNSQTFYMGAVCNDQPAICGSTNPNCAVIEKFEGGAQTSVAFQPATFTANQPFTFTIQGTNLTLISGSTTVTASDSTITGPGKVGILDAMGNGFKSFSVTALSF